MNLDNDCEHDLKFKSTCLELWEVKVELFSLTVEKCQTTVYNALGNVPKMQHLRHKTIRNKHGGYQ